MRGGGWSASDSAAYSPSVWPRTTTAWPVWRASARRPTWPRSRADPAELVERCVRTGVIRPPGIPASLESWAKELSVLRPKEDAELLKGRPLLVVHGADDPDISVDDARALSESATGAGGPAGRLRRGSLAAGGSPGDRHPWSGGWSGGAEGSASECGQGSGRWRCARSRAARCGSSASVRWRTTTKWRAPARARSGIFAGRDAAGDEDRDRRLLRGDCR